MKNPHTAKLIESALERAPFTGSDLARQLKITPQGVYEWLSGETRPTKSRWAPLCKALGISRASLLTAVNRDRGQA